MVTADYLPTEEDYRYMGRALELGGVALENSTTPVGAVLVHTPSGQVWEGSNREFCDDDLLAHPEMIVYTQAQEVLGRDLSECALYTPTETCLGCSYFVVDKGNLGALYIGALRNQLQFFRSKRDNPDKPDMHDILRTSRRSFTVVTGLMRAEAEALLRPENNVHHQVS
jgi:tRNA(Arg) A34 adenosine deaminase TadA